MRKKSAFFFLMTCVLLSVTQGIGAVTVEDLVGPENAKALRATGTVKRIEMKDPVPTMVPSGMMGDKYVTEITSFEPTLLVEALYLYPKPVNGERGSWSIAERTAIYNSIRALSTLAGIEYYSASRQRMRTFYETSVIIDGPDSTTVLPDPVVQVPPERATLYAIQKDLTFGENRYRYEYHAENAGLAFVQENLTSMKYGIFPILGKNKLRTTVLVLDTDDSLVMYAVSAARAIKVPGLETKVRNSFSNRADAIFGWFSKRADEAFKLALEKK
jgi:hypothetical protein